MTKYLITIIIMLIFCYASKAQEYSLTDSVFSIDVVDISAGRRVLFAANQQQQSIDFNVDKYLSTKPVADVLRHKTLLNIKSYGYGGLTNISVRGMNAGHTAVLWNGFNLQNPLNGGFDFSNISSLLFDNIDIQQGGSCALFGSGAAGGIISFSNKIGGEENYFEVKTGLHLRSFAALGVSSSIEIKKNWYSGSFRFVSSNAKNNFKYHVNGIGEKRQINAATKLNGITSTHKFNTGKNHHLALHLWWQDNHRQIPPNISISKSEASDNNNFTRLSANWQYISKNASVSVRTAYLDDNYTYSDPISEVESCLLSKTFLTEAETKINISNTVLLNAGIGNNYEKGTASNYLFAPVRNRLYSYISAKSRFFNEHLGVISTMRYEYIEMENAPPTFSLALSYYANLFSLHTSLSRNYRLPTFNDLFWKTGGNQDLMSETGYSKEFGGNFWHRFGKNRMKTSLVVFENNMKNQIVWTPDGTFWKPENKQKVISRGIETESSFEFFLSDWRAKIDVRYHFLKTKIAHSNNNKEVGKEIIYTPSHKALLNIEWHYKTITANYNQHYTGKQYVLSDNTASIPAYSTAGFSLTNEFSSKGIFLIDVVLSINNIWNVQYQSIMWYAMPGRNYALSLVCKFTKK